MKQLLTLLFAIFAANLLLAQSVGIGTTNPNSSAQLDISSTTKGLLIPRMTGAQRAAIPANFGTVGMMVVQTNTETSPPSSPGLYLLERAGINYVWKRIARTDEITSGVSTWTVNGIDQYSNVAGNVGIGIATPAEKLHLIGNFRQDDGTITLNNSASIIQFQNNDVDKTYIQLSGNNLRMGTNTGNDLGKMIIRMDGSDKVTIDSTGNMLIIGEQDASLTSNGYLTLGSLSGRNIILDNNEIMARDDSAASDLLFQYDGGNVGIGSVTPDERLTFTGNAKLMGAAGLIKFETAVGGTGSPITSTKYAPGLQFLREGTTTNLAKIEYVDTSNFANFIRLRMGSTIENGITLNSSNYTGLGTNDPVARLHVKGEPGIDEVAITSGALNESSSIQFYNTLIGGTLSSKKAFVLLDAEDLKVGTNSGNTTGKFVVRTGGADRLMVSADGNTGVGLDPAGFAAKLVVSGESLFLGDGVDAFEAIGNAVINGRLRINRDLEAIRLDGNDPAINFFESNVQRGYLWMINNDMNLGTSNSAGKIFLNSAQINMQTSQVTIGTSIATPGDYKLGVGGKVICEEVRVKLQNNGWPDYVFSQDYKLKSLEEIENFIKLNKHLPNIPSAQVIDKEGLEVGDMQRRMMEKIEELTLYIIEQNKRITALENSLPQSSKK